MNDGDEVELLQRWRAGDQVAGRELFERTFPALRRFFVTKLGDSVEDLIQDTLLACVESCDRIRDPGAFRAYLYAVARHRLYAHLAERAAERNIDPTVTCVEDMGASPSGMLARHRDNRVLLCALRRIPLDFQIALELYYWEGLGTRELADILGIKRSTVMSRLARARALLTEQVETVEPGSALATTTDDLQRWAQRIRDIVDQDP